MSDEDVVSWQLGRPARAFRRVAARCSHGFPAVTEQHSTTAAGEPFPTTFYLTCPWLVAAVSRIEAAGGVARWNERAEDDPALAASLAEAQARQRELRPELPVGIAGTANDRSLKCLHAHAAFALAQPPYLVGEQILEEVTDRWCPDRRCAAACGGSAG